jgi:predicted DNA-binding ribbon-helix-helix protein
VALEAEFWAVIEAAARREGTSLAALVAGIDGTRGERPLASALRLYALGSARAGL